MLHVAPSTIRDIVEAHEPSSIGLVGENETVTREHLRDSVETIASRLVSRGLERTDRVAIVVRNGPGAVMAFLGSTLAAVAAPLNPAYPEAEFTFAMRDLPARVLLTDGSSSAAIAAANALGIPQLDLGDILASPPANPEAPRPAPDNVALILHTSGTTGTPKRVPLTHSNLAASASNIAASLALAPNDRCLNVMPLFHIHGLMAGALATLSSGGSVVCTPGFDSFRMVSWLESFQPTWYTAVPTMHQALLARLRADSRINHNLRFIRSCSSALPGAVHREIEERFNVPFVEAYGMTEASHQIATNPLPPQARLPGSVGLPSGVEVAVFGEDSLPSAPGATGEIGIRGRSVTSGYEGIDPTEFTYPGGWLRTGDQGFLDSSGYVHLTGRLKELINRGGEKIAPREVEEALLAHPAVAEAVVFGVPHPMLGEEVAATVVVAANARQPTTAELRAVVAEQLASFKVPRKIVFVDQIPVGPTGKPQRVGMGQRLGLA
ncbi:MAG: AMP-binding protein [Dehalococcoidia bacterium]